MAGANQRVVYLNGAFVPESEAMLPFRDRGVKFGDAAFDTTRTFGHRIFRLREHLDRFMRSLRYLRIDPGLDVDGFMRVTEELVARNLALLDGNDDYWVTQRVTRGIDPGDREFWPDWTGPTVIVECVPLPLAERAPLFRDGLEVVTPSVRRTGPGMLSPRAKTHNYLNLVMGDLEVAAWNDQAMALLLDENGNLSEGKGSNLFLVEDGRLKTPRARYVLPGVSRQVTFELADTLGIPVEEADIDLFDAYNADEGFITSTSFCICPARGINGRRFGETGIPGPVTKRLMDAYVELVGFDWVDQYLRRLAA